MQAIETKFVGPTNHRGQRVIARAQAGRLTWSWDYSKNVDENHDAAAKALADKLGWGGIWHGGGNVTGTGNVYVCERWHDGAFHVTFRTVGA